MRKFFLTILVIISIPSYSQESDLIFLWTGKVPGEIKEKQKPV